MNNRPDLSLENFFFDEYCVGVISVAAAHRAGLPLRGGDCGSGDFAGVYAYARHRLRVLLVDVAGHGDEARPFHDHVDGWLHEQRGISPLEWMLSVHQGWPSPVRFGTLVLAEIDLGKHNIICLRAGHPDPIFRADTQTARFLDAPNVGVVGIDDALMADAPPRLPSLPFPPGGMLLMHSDGVLDAGVKRRGEAFGADRLLGAVSAIPPCRDWLLRVAGHVLDHLDGDPPEDDFTLVAVYRRSAVYLPRCWRQESTPTIAA
jgi:serine phosphatase RsbU (regulator of sigma subunit)